MSLKIQASYNKKEEFFYENVCKAWKSFRDFLGISLHHQFYLVLDSSCPTATEYATSSNDILWVPRYGYRKLYSRPYPKLYLGVYPFLFILLGCLLLWMLQERLTSCFGPLKRAFSQFLKSPSSALRLVSA